MYPTARVSGKGEARADVVVRQIGEIIENLVDCHPAGQILQHVVDRDSHSPDARLTTALTGFECDVLSPVHALSVGLAVLGRQTAASPLMSHPRRLLSGSLMPR